MIQLTLPIPDSYLVICPQCFDVWARLSGQDTSFWWHRYVPCEQHSAPAYGFKTPGSLLDAEDLIDVLPEELLRREFDLLVKGEIECPHNRPFSLE